MPTYDYQCGKCETVFEVVHPMTDESPQMCATCNVAMSKVFSVPKIQYKGSGWAWQEKIPQRTDIVIGSDPSKNH